MSSKRPGPAFCNWTVVALLGAVGCAPTPARVSNVGAEIDGGVGTLIRVHWSQDLDADSWTEFDLGDGEWLQSPVTARTAGDHEELILGAPGDTEVYYRVVTDLEGEVFASDQQSIRTDPLPEDLLEPVLAAFQENATSPEGYVLGSVDVDGGFSYSGPFWLFIADRLGRIVWYHDLEYRMSMFPRVARDGSHLVFDQRSFFDFTGESSVIHKITLDKRYDEEIPAPGLGWCWDETDDGLLLYDQSVGVDTITLQELAPDGSSRTVWDCNAWQSPFGLDSDHCYTNTVNWVPETDSVLWSTYWGDYVLEVERQSGRVLWYAGDIADGWTIQPESAAFDLQHYPNYSPVGTLLVSTHVPGEDGQQRAREFSLDEDRQVLTEIWSYGEGVEGYAKYSGEAVRLANGNTLINYGTGGEIREVTPEKETVWSLQFGEDHTLGHSVLIADLYELNRGP